MVDAEEHYYYRAQNLLLECLQIIAKQCTRKEISDQTEVVESQCDDKENEDRGGILLQISMRSFLYSVFDFDLSDKLFFCLLLTR